MNISVNGISNAQQRAYHLAFTPLIVTQALFDGLSAEARVVTYPLNMVGSVASTLLLTAASLAFLGVTFASGLTNTCLRSKKCRRITRDSALGVLTGFYFSGCSLVNAFVPGYLLKEDEK